MTICVKLEFDKQTYDIWLMEILETFPWVFWFQKLRIKENGGKGLQLICDPYKSVYCLWKQWSRV